MKIYIVTSGCYSDYGIDGIFDSKELAQKFIDSFESSKFNDIEEYELNPYLKELRAGFKAYFLRMSKEGVASDIRIEDSAYGFSEAKREHGFDVRNNMYLHVFAKDEQHAIKIANEKRVQILSNFQWPVFYSDLFPLALFINLFFAPLILFLLLRRVMITAINFNVTFIV